MKSGNKHVYALVLSLQCESSSGAVVKDEELASMSNYDASLEITELSAAVVDAERNCTLRFMKFNTSPSWKLFPFEASTHGGMPREFLSLAMAVADLDRILYDLLANQAHFSCFVVTLGEGVLRHLLREAELKRINLSPCFYSFYELRRAFAEHVGPNAASGTFSTFVSTSSTKSSPTKSSPSSTSSSSTTPLNPASTSPTHASSSSGSPLASMARTLGLSNVAMGGSVELKCEAEVHVLARLLSRGFVFGAPESMAHKSDRFSAVSSAGSSGSPIDVTPHRVSPMLGRIGGGPVNSEYAGGSVSILRESVDGTNSSSEEDDLQAEATAMAAAQAALTTPSPHPYDDDDPHADVDSALPVHSEDGVGLRGGSPLPYQRSKLLHPLASSEVSQSLKQLTGKFTSSTTLKSPPSTPSSTSTPSTSTLPSTLPSVGATGASLEGGNPEEEEEGVREEFGGGDDEGDSEEQSSVVRLRGLPFRATEEDLVTFFGHLEIAVGGIVLNRNKRGRATGDGFVKFVSHEEQQKALNRDKQFLGRRYIEIFPSTEERFLTAQSMSQSPRPRKARPSDPPAVVETGVVRLRGCPYETSDEDVRSFFAGLTIPTDGILLVRDHMNRASGEGYVRFATLEETAEALKRDKSRIGRRYLEVFPSDNADMENARARLARGGSNPTSLNTSGNHSLMSSGGAGV